MQSEAICKFTARYNFIAQTGLISSRNVIADHEEIPSLTVFSEQMYNKPVTGSVQSIL